MYVRAIETGVGLGFERWFGLLWVSQQETEREMVVELVLVLF